GSGGVPGPPQPATKVAVRRFELAPGATWHAATHALLRHLTGKAGGGPPLPEPPPTYQEVHLLLGDDHPAYATAPSVLGHALPPGAWYVRVPDLPAFVRRITPVLEARLAASVLAGYSGEVPISFYRSGLRLRFERGRLAVEPWPRAPYREALALFPGLTFT